MQVGDLVGPYTIFEVITHETRRAEGTYIARRAEEGACRHDVALEVFAVGDGDSSLMWMSLHESRLACRFAHRNIARLNDLGLAGTHAFIATEHLPGATLAELQGQVPLDVAIACEVCAGLHYLHSSSLAMAGRSRSFTALSLRRTSSSGSTAASSFAGVGTFRWIAGTGCSRYAIACSTSRRRSAGPLPSIVVAIFTRSRWCYGS